MWASYEGTLRQWQPYRGDGLRGDAFAAAGEAEPLGRRRLDADPVGRDFQDFGDPLDHAVAIWRDLRPLADDRHVDRRDRAAALAHQRSGVSEKAVRGGAPPARIARREMHADIAGADRAKHG